MRPEFGHDRAEDLAARRDVDAEERLDRVVPADVVADGREVVHPADDGDVLVVVEVLAELLEAGVQVSDVWCAAGDALAVEFEDEAEGGVGRGVLGPEVEDPSVAGVDVLGEVLGGVCVDGEVVVGLEGVGHPRAPVAKDR